MQAMMAMNSQCLTIKVKPFSGKKEDYPKCALKQKQSFIMTDMGHVLDKMFLGNLSRSKDMKLDDSSTKHKAWAKYRQLNTKAGAAIVGVQESEDVICALQEANELELT